MLEDIDTREKGAHTSNKDMDELDFQILLMDNYYVNRSSIHICFPMKIKKSTSQTTDIDSDLITVNNFFTQLIKEISIAKYGRDKELIPTFSPYEIYQYSDSMLKHLPADSLKKLEKTLLYSKEPVYYNSTSIDRRIHNGDTSGFTMTGFTATQLAMLKKNNAKDLHIDKSIEKFQERLKNEYVYRIPLKYFTDLGKINFPIKIDFMIKCHPKKEMKRLFESRKVHSSTAVIPAPNAKIFTRAPFIKYKQILLEKDFRQYLETIMVSKKILRWEHK